MRDETAMRRSTFLLALLLPLAACTTKPPPPPPAPPPAPPPPPPPPVIEDWRDRAETPGNWTYARDAAATSARFGLTAPLFVIRCDIASHLVSLTRIGGTAAAMRVETSYSAIDWPAQATSDGTVVSLPARDPFLDKIAFSRGRFTVAVAGLPELIMPAWAEPARVFEDCRG